MAIKPMTKTFTFRWQDYDFEFIRKQADRLNISKSDYIRRLIQRDKEDYEKKHPA